MSLSYEENIDSERYDRLSDLLGPEYAEKWDSLSKAYAMCEAQLAEHDKNDFKVEKIHKVFAPCIFQRRMWQFIGNANERLPLAVVKVDDGNEKQFEAWVRVDPLGKSIERHHLLNLFETKDSKEAISHFLNLVNNIRFQDPDIHNNNEDKCTFLDSDILKSRSDLSISKMSTLINKEIKNILRDCEMNTVSMNDLKISQVKKHEKEISVEKDTKLKEHSKIIKDKEFETDVEVSKSVQFCNESLAKDMISHKSSTSIITEDSRQKNYKDKKPTNLGGGQLKRLQSNCLFTHSDGRVPSYRYRLAEISQPAISRTGLIAFTPQLSFVQSTSRPAFNLYYRL